jgi:hypothetical protein
MIICPYCNQGQVLQARLKPNIGIYSDSQLVRFCDECDALWKETETISEHTGTSFRMLAKMLSIPETALWEDMEVIS